MPDGAGQVAPPDTRSTPRLGVHCCQVLGAICNGRVRTTSWPAGGALAGALFGLGSGMVRGPYAGPATRAGCTPARNLIEWPPGLARRGPRPEQVGKAPEVGHPGHRCLPVSAVARWPRAMRPYPRGLRHAGPFACPAEDTADAAECCGRRGGTGRCLGRADSVMSACRCRAPVAGHFLDFIGSLILGCALNGRGRRSGDEGMERGGPGRQRARPA